MHGHAVDKMQALKGEGWLGLEARWGPQERLLGLPPGSGLGQCFKAGSLFVVSV